MNLLRQILIAVSFALLLSGCGTLDPTGVYAGDKLRYEVEVATPAAFAFFQTFVEWEYQNRAAFADRPEVKKGADFIRANAPKWKASVLSLHALYLADPNPETRKSLENILGLIRGALTEATRYMSPPPPKPTS